VGTPIDQKTQAAFDVYFREMYPKIFMALSTGELSGNEHWLVTIAQTAFLAGSQLGEMKVIDIIKTIEDYISSGLSHAEAAIKLEVEHGIQLAEAEINKLFGTHLGESGGVTGAVANAVIESPTSTSTDSPVNTDSGTGTTTDTTTEGADDSLGEPPTDTDTSASSVTDPAPSSHGSNH
jgi:hypothetical protein